MTTASPTKETKVDLKHLNETCNDEAHNEVSINEKCENQRDNNVSTSESATQISQNDVESVREGVQCDIGEKLSEAIPTDSVEEDKPSERDSLPIRSPLKKPRTAYFIFQDGKRPQIKADYPSESIGTTAKRVGQLWAALAIEEKEKYKTQAADERKRHNEATSKMDTGTSENDKSSKRKIDEEGACILPLARIRKICRLDPEVRSISKEALLILTKAAEHFTQKLGSESNSMAQMQSRRTLLPADVLDVCSLKAPFFFVKDDIQDLIKEQTAEKKKKLQSEPQINKQLNVSSRLDGVKPLTSYFKLK